MLLSQLSIPVLDCSEIASLRAFTFFMSTRISPDTVTPKSWARRAMYAASALATSVFVGMHPVLTHVPPKLLRSIMAIFIPAWVRRPAKEGPAWPVPMMIASYFPAMTR